MQRSVVFVVVVVGQVGFGCAALLGCWSYKSFPFIQL